MLDFDQQSSFDLVIEVWSDTTNTVTIVGATKSGIFTRKIVPTSNGVVLTTTFGMGEIPIWLSAFSNANIAFLGQTYVRISLQVNGDIVSILTAGYVSRTNGITWPNGSIKGPLEGIGRIKTIVGTDQAAGAEISETVTSRFLWKLKSIIFTLVTDATVASRIPSLTIEDTNGVFLRVTPSGSQAASITRNHCFGAGLGVTNNTTTNIFNTPILTDVILPSDAIIKTVTTAIVAGDNYGAPILLVEQFIAGAAN